MTHLFRTVIATATIAAAALSGVAHADTHGEIAKYDAKTRTYCVSYTAPGWVIRQRDCETRQGWIDRGAVITPAPDKQIAAK